MPRKKKPLRGILKELGFIERIRTKKPVRTRFGLRYRKVISPLITPFRFGDEGILGGRRKCKKFVAWGRAESDYFVRFNTRRARSLGDAEDIFLGIKKGKVSKVDFTHEEPDIVHFDTIECRD